MPKVPIRGRDPLRYHTNRTIHSKAASRQRSRKARKALSVFDAFGSPKAPLNLKDYRRLNLTINMMSASLTPFHCVGNYIGQAAMKEMEDLGATWVNETDATTVLCQPTDVMSRIGSGKCLVTTADPLLVSTLGKLFTSACKVDVLRLVIHDPSVQQHLDRFGIKATYIPANGSSNSSNKALYKVASQPSTHHVLSGEMLLHHLLWRLRDYSVDSASKTFCMANNVYMTNTDRASALFSMAIRKGVPFVVVTNNSDDNITNAHSKYLSHQLLKAWFAQNANIVHEKLHVLPIGIANSSWPHGDMGALVRVIATTAHVAKTKECYLGSDIKTNRAERKPTKKIAKHYPWLNQRLDYESYLTLLAQHRFCVCPEGAGVDTHRFWECLYLNVVPIVRRNAESAWISYWEDRVPMLIVSSWDQVTPSLLAKEVHYPEGWQQWLNADTYVSLILQSTHS